MCPEENAPASQEPRMAVVNLSVAFLREVPDYTGELGTQALMGTIVEIVGEEGYWRNVISPEPYNAWVNALALTEMNSREITEYSKAPKYMCTAWHSTVYSSPDETSLKLCDLVEGNVLRKVLAEKNGKALVTKGFAVVMLPDGRTGYVPREDLQDYQEWSESRNPTPENIIAEAMKFHGIQYMWGGMSPNGVDCSGLVHHVYMMNGIALPRNASQMIGRGKVVDVNPNLDILPSWKIEETLSAEEKAAADEAFEAEMEHRIANLQPCDLLFFGYVKDDGSYKITHVGMYIGDGKLIHSSQVVRVNSLLPSGENYYENSHRLLAARRILK